MDNTSFWPENKYPDSRNDKGELCCYKCGSTVHFAVNCDGSGIVGPVKLEKGFEKGFKIHPMKISKKAMVEDIDDKDDLDSEN